MKILIVSHNVFSNTTSMGKTLTSYFAGIKNLELAQFYIHSEVPTSNVCSNYFRITDKDILKSIFTRKSGTVLTDEDIEIKRSNPRFDKGFTGSIYQQARKRSPLIYFMRNLIWKIGKWNTLNLQKWLDDFQPDAVFFASGDYAFMYDIALYIAKSRKILLYVCCMDDYYINNKNIDKFCGKYIHNCFMKQAHKTIDYATGIFCICDKMSDDYSRLFKKVTYTLHTAASFYGPLLKNNDSNRISYIGNLGFDRYKQLIDIGRALLKVHFDKKPDYIDVYSAEKRPEVLALLTKENGIDFHGEIDAQEVKKVMSESMLLIHTEDFALSNRKAVAYSISTKIADSLASGVCLLAYGPSEVASMKYLQENDVAFCITDKDCLENSLKVIISDSVERERIVVKALRLASLNHIADNVTKTIKRVIKTDS